MKEQPLLARIDDLTIQVDDEGVVLTDERMDAHWTLSYCPDERLWGTVADCSSTLKHRTIVASIMIRLIENGRQLDMQTAQFYDGGMEAVRRGGFRTPYTFVLDPEEQRIFREQLDDRGVLGPPGPSRKRSWHELPPSWLIAGFASTTPSIIDEDSKYTLFVGLDDTPSTLSAIGYGQATRDTPPSRRTLLQL